MTAKPGIKNAAIPHQVLPRAGAERESLREKGQFWTPAWVAEAMVAYILGTGSRRIFDPAVGGGAFLLAAKQVGKGRGRKIHLAGAELYRSALLEAAANGLTKADLAGVEVTDFLDMPLNRRQVAIVANPPYLRHHRIPKGRKEFLQADFRRLTGIKLDGRAGLHVYFLIHALRLLKPGGRLAFIVPADICEGVFSQALLRWVTRHYRLDAVVTFACDATPFPGVDTNPLVLLIRNEKPRSLFKWCRCEKWGTNVLCDWVERDLKGSVRSGIKVLSRKIEEGLNTGFSRAPCVGIKGYALARFARTMRGIATGDNDFFFLSHHQMEQLGLPEEFFVRAVGRTRDAPGGVITVSDLNALDAQNRPTFLFSAGGQALIELPAAVRDYLEEGERRGLPNRPLISQRRPWYRMESRVAPSILFAYLGRRNARFIRNLAGAVPLTGFLCVYPKAASRDFVERLYGALNDPRTLANLALVGKSYGGGAIKVEPRALERLLIPEAVVAEFGLNDFLEPEQAALAI